MDELLLQDAHNLHKPVLGICYGLQTLNVWRTGTLIQHLDSQVQHNPKDDAAPAHKIEIEADSLLAREIGQPEKQAIVAVNSSHHQAAKDPGDALRVVARCPADGVIEALEGTDSGHYVLAVQWHAEMLLAEQPHRALFEELVAVSSGVTQLPVATPLAA